MIYLVHINEDTLSFAEKENFKTECVERYGKDGMFLIKTMKYEDFKTLSQLKAFHGPMLDQGVAIERDFGNEYTREELKQYWKEKFLGYEDLLINGKHVYREAEIVPTGEPVVDAAIDAFKNVGVKIRVKVAVLPSLGKMKKGRMTKFMKDIMSHYLHHVGRGIVLTEKEQIDCGLKAA